MLCGFILLFAYYTVCIVGEILHLDLLQVCVTNTFSYTFELYHKSCFKKPRDKQNVVSF